MEKGVPIGTRIRYISYRVRHELQGKTGTIVPHEDVKISFPDTTAIRINICRLDEISGSLYFAASPENYEIIGPPERPVRCVIKEKELIAHTTAIKRLIRAIKGHGGGTGELLRCADAAIDKIAEIAEMTKIPRGVELVPELAPELER